MPDKPSADVVISEELVRAVIAAQATSIADADSLPLMHVADGWDCSVWRLGSELAVRLPRRAVAAPLISHEQRVLPGIATRLADAGVGVPAPLVAGRPGHGYPWSWSVVPWFDGTSGLTVPRHRRSGWAAPLARALLALHVTSAGDHPVNPVRGVPLETRAESVEARLASLTGRASDEALSTLRRLWHAALAAPAWDRTPVWIHGDLHPGNLIADDTHLVAIIDFGDVTAGDPAYDLAVGWLAFDAVGRSQFVRSMQGHYTSADWTRAHGWAAAMALILLDHSDDNPEYASLAAEAIVEITRGS